MRVRCDRTAKLANELADKAFPAGALPANEPNDQGLPLRTKLPRSRRTPLRRVLPRSRRASQAALIPEHRDQRNSKSRRNTQPQESSRGEGRSKTVGGAARAEPLTPRESLPPGSSTFADHAAALTDPNGRIWEIAQEPGYWVAPIPRRAVEPLFGFGWLRIDCLGQRANGV